MTIIHVHENLGELVPIDELMPWPGNPRVGNIGAMIESIQRNGLYRPLYVQRSTKYILAGNHAYQAMRQLDQDYVPVVWLDVDDETARRILLIDNRMGELGGTDTAKIVPILEMLDDLVGTGYTNDDLAKFLEADTAEIIEDLDSQPKLADLQYRIIVDCRDEHDQQDLLQALEREGRTCRPLIS